MLGSSMCMKLLTFSQIKCCVYSRGIESVQDFIQKCGYSPQKLWCGDEN